MCTHGMLGIEPGTDCHRNKRGGRHGGHIIYKVHTSGHMDMDMHMVMDMVHVSADIA